MDKEEKEIYAKIGRWKLLAKQFLAGKKKIFIKDIDNNWYFADIILIGEQTITIKCFAPSERIGEEYILNWLSIIKFDEYKDGRSFAKENYYYNG